jgi:peptidoglycan-associated lipoprotein
MLLRKTVYALLLLAAVVSACARRGEVAPPPGPTDVGPDTAELRRQREREAELARARARVDSIRAANEARTRARAALDEMVFFDYDRAEIRSDMQDVLNRKVEVLRANRDVALRIEGHADERGSVEYNLALSLRRATSVRDYLTGYGLDANRFQVAALGEERPLDPASNESAWARNRRAEFIITRGADRLR